MLNYATFSGSDQQAGHLYTTVCWHLNYFCLNWCNFISPHTILILKIQTIPIHLMENQNFLLTEVTQNIQDNNQI